MLLIEVTLDLTGVNTYFLIILHTVITLLSSKFYLSVPYVSVEVRMDLQAVQTAHILD
jgi:hypothetical protein